MNLTELKKKSPSDLMTMAGDMGIENIARARKQEVIFSILKSHAKNGEDIFGDGVLEILFPEFNEWYTLFVLIGPQSSVITFLTIRLFLWQIFINEFGVK